MLTPTEVDSCTPAPAH